MARGVDRNWVNAEKNGIVQQDPPSTRAGGQDDGS